MVKLVEVTDQEIGDELPYDIIQDLIVYMRNDPMFYRKHLYPALVDVQDAVQNGGRYSKKNLIPLIDKGLQAYTNRFSIKKLPTELMNNQEKIECITKLLADEQENFKEGTY